jgi:4-amino-4-deoxy-L-arabinose transferase-like glycosyltransferase
MNTPKQKNNSIRNYDLQRLLKASANKINTILFIICLVSLLIKVTAYILTKDMFEGMFPDRYQYIAYGEQIAEGNWNPDLGGSLMYVAPGLPLIVALMKVLFKDSTMPVLILNMILSSSGVFILYYLGREIFNHKIGLIMGLWMAVYYPAIKFSLFVYKEPLIYFLLPLTLLLLIRSIRKGFDIKNILLSSITYAILIHIDERFIIYLPIFPLVYFINKNSVSISNKLRSSILWIIFVIIMLIPWTIRNYQIYNQLVIISPRTTAFSSKLFGDNLWKNYSETEPSYNVNTKKLSLISYKDFYAKQAGKIAREQKKELRMYGNKEAKVRAFFNYWQPTYFKPHFIINGYRVEQWLISANITSILYYGIFLPFYVLGIILLVIKKDRMALFIAFLPIIHSLIHAYLVIPLGRYRSPMDFIVALIGLWAIFELYKYFVHVIGKKRAVL